ncbi:endonuclease/exonuclease/phosphatase family protein [Microbacterium sp. RD1]|uniref:endonuclease/exonuclease/phosphatase family protein n=1 Tax=Microbacterium sp. RD1 TaxID=3457313 RepID=UPI003FA5F284
MDSIRAMTWNVWWRFGGNWREREPGLLRVVRDVAPDILGIQECWGTGDGTQADVVAEAFSASAAFVEMDLPPAAEEGEGAVMGLGLVSRWPITEVGSVPLPSDDRRNNALVASIDSPFGELRVVVGAVSWEPERVAETAQQVAALQRLTREGRGERAAPSILLADLNYDPTQPALAALQMPDAWDAADPHADPRTLSETNRFAPSECEDQWNRRIDHVRYFPGTAGARATHAEVIRDEPDGLPPSDHYPVVADIAVGEGPSAPADAPRAAWLP